jgi:hypothetical protein
LTVKNRAAAGVVVMALIVSHRNGVAGAPVMRAS